MSDVNVSVTYSDVGIAVSATTVSLPVTVNTVSAEVTDFDETLAAWTLASAFSITTATRDSDGVITTASILWPDGSAGTFTRTAKNATFLTIDAYTATHTDSGKTATQAAVTRDSSGNVTAQPAITIA